MAERQADKEKCKGKERFIQAAQRLLEDRPFDEITIDEIIKSAKLSRPTFYYHFAGGKEELRTEMVQRGILHDTPTHDTRQIILEAGLRVFARAGISAATMEDIAAEAGVTRGTLLWHFHSKDDLLSAILKNFGPHSMLRTEVEQIEQELQSGVALDDEAIFRRLAGAFYDAFMDQENHARLAVLLIHTHPEVAQIIADKIVKGRKGITEYVQKRQEEGYFCKHIDPGFFVQVMALTFAMRAISRGLNDLLPYGHLSRDEIVDQLVSLLLYGMVRRDAPQTAEAT
jgi:TetR/AcrR family transcriptional regulator